MAAFSIINKEGPPTIYSEWARLSLSSPLLATGGGYSSPSLGTGGGY